jgi:hypothetical protein
MRNNLLMMILLICTDKINAQSCIGFEQYIYTDNKGIQLLVPVVYFQSNNSWYIESHVNYETEHTFSVYAGKAFSGNKEISYTVTPMIGGVLGSIKGGVIGLNADINYKKIFFSSQSQYICSFTDRSIDFLYTWIELGYEVYGHHQVGLALQHTMRWGPGRRPETGFFIKLNAKKWNFPMYCFNVGGENRYLVLGICREFGLPLYKTNSTLPVKQTVYHD